MMRGGHGVVGAASGHRVGGGATLRMCANRVGGALCGVAVARCATGQVWVCVCVCSHRDAAQRGYAVAG